MNPNSKQIESVGAEISVKNGILDKKYVKFDKIQFFSFISAPTNPIWLLFGFIR